MDSKDQLETAIAARRDDLIALTQDLIRIPTLNPPGQNYREICDYLKHAWRQRTDPRFDPHPHPQPARPKLSRNLRLSQTPLGGSGVHS